MHLTQESIAFMTLLTTSLHYGFYDRSKIGCEIKLDSNCTNQKQRCSSSVCGYIILYVGAFVSFFLFLKPSPVFKLGGIRHCDHGVCNHFGLHSASAFNTRITFDITFSSTGVGAAVHVTSKKTPRQASKHLNLQHRLQFWRVRKTLCCLGKFLRNDLSKKISADARPTL